MTLSTRLWKLPFHCHEQKKINIYNILLINMTQSCQIKQRYTFPCILCLLNNTCVQHNFKSVHVSNLFWSREYNSAKEICKYPSFSKVGGNYPLNLKIIWSSVSVMSQWVQEDEIFRIDTIVYISNVTTSPRGWGLQNWHYCLY